MENTTNNGNGAAPKNSADQPFFRVTIEVRSSPGDAFENLQEKVSEKANALLDFIRRGVDIRIQTTAKAKQDKAERINIE